jgi:hypothetical protein
MSRDNRKSTRKTTRKTTNSRNTGRVKPGPKSKAEAKIERATAMLLVAVFAVMYITEQQNIDLPNALVPFAGAVILLGSGLYQYGQRWRVSPWTWISGTVLLMLTVYNMQIDPNANFYGISLFIFAIVLAVGLFTGET